MNKHPDDGKYVVTQNGQRVSDLKGSEHEALEEAKRLKKIQEGQGQAAASAPIEVKQNLLG